MITYLIKPGFGCYQKMFRNNDKYTKTCPKTAMSLALSPLKKAMLGREQHGHGKLATSLLTVPVTAAVFTDTEQTLSTSIHL